ncbi:unnamed protein product, partial [Rotaria magnacalcarata]
MYHRFDSGLLPKENTANTLTHLVDHTIALSDHARLLEKRIRELRFSLENGVTTPTSNEDINELQENQNPTSSIEHDSGSSENELNQTTAESNPPKSNQHLQLLNSLSDVESG